MFKQKSIYLALLFIFLTVAAESQIKRLKFENIHLEHGLSQSTITAIIQDSQGFMWFGTLDGLNKYNGYEMQAYRRLGNKRNTIIDNEITCLYESKSGNLWVGTKTNALSKYNRISDSFENYFFNNESAISYGQNYIRSICEDGDGNLWLGTDKGLYKYSPDKQQFTAYKNPFSYGSAEQAINHVVYSPDGYLLMATGNGIHKFNLKTKTSLYYKSYTDAPNSLLSNQILCLAFDADRKLWIGTDKGLNSMEGDQFKVHKIAKDGENALFSKVNTLFSDAQGILWIGTEGGGLLKKSPNSDEFIAFKNDPSDRTSLSNNVVRGIYSDRSGILWVGTSLGGINKWNRAAEDIDVFRHNPYDPKSLSNSLVRCFYQSKDGILWVGTIEGGLNYTDTQLRSFKAFKHIPGDLNAIPNNHVRDILEDSQGNFWVATDGGGLSLLNRKTKNFKSFKNTVENTSISSNRVWHLEEDRSGNLWVATMGGLNLFDRKTQTFKRFEQSDKDPNSISSNSVTWVFEASDSTLWVGTTNGLNKLNRKTDEFTHYFKNDSDSTSIGNSRIYSIIEDSEGTVWVGTKGGGLSKYLPKTDNFRNYSVEHGLPNDVVMGILEDNGGNLWISTNRGISKFSKKTTSVRNFDVRDGLQSNEFLVGSFMKSANGEMFFGGVNGFNAFFPEQIRDNPHVPAVLITGFRVSNKDYQLDSAISVKKVIHLPYYKNFLSFDFVALDYVFPEKNRYAYILNNYDEELNDVGYRRFANYTNLPPGKYVFKVKGSNNDDIWNEEGAEVFIYIHPAFWQTNWFLYSVFLFTLISIAMWVRSRFERIRQQKVELERLVKLRTAEVVKQKEEIEAQKDEIETQRDNLQEQKDMITEQNKEIKDSIEYALHIQKATLETLAFDNDFLSDYFIVFRPKDIVSGDYYWASDKPDIFAAVAADCTGHGVPGAFMSMLGVSLLNKIVNERGVHSPEKVLNMMRDNIIHSLHQKSSDSTSRDGMDMVICVIDKVTKKLYFAGANNPIYIVRNGEAETLKADKMPVAIYDTMDSFTLTEYDLQSGDWIYMFSDGFADQFGGPKGKKIKYAPFRDMLIEQSANSGAHQQVFLNTFLDDWMKGYEQIDDILLIGVKI